MKIRFAHACAAALALPMVGAAQGQLLFDFESGLQGWGTSGFGNGTEFVALSPTGATEGSAQALSFGHDSGEFSWDASWVIDDNDPAFATDPVVAALSAAAAAPAGKTLEMDLTWQANDLGSFSTFANVAVSLQSDGGFNSEFNLAEITVAQDATIPIVLTFDTSGIAGADPNSGFWRLTIATNTDAGRGTLTAYVDNIRIVPEPASAALLGLGGLGLMLRRRNA